LINGTVITLFIYFRYASKYMDMMKIKIKIWKKEKYQLKILSLN